MATDWLTSTLGTKTTQKTETKTTRSSDWLDSTNGTNKTTTYQPNQLTSNIQPEPITQSIAPKGSLIKKVATETGKFLGRTGAGLLNQAASAVDFVFDMAVRNSKPVISVGGYTPKVIQQMTDTWRSAYEEQRKNGETPTQKLKEVTVKLQNIPYLKPPEDYVNSTLKDKMTKRLPETILQIGPSVLSSIVPYIFGTGAGFTVAALTTADDVKSSAIEAGVTPWKAEKLGIGTGLLVGLLDKIVPQEIIGNAQKKEFVQLLSKKLARLAINTGKEVGTEILQEDVQILAESTFRDLGIDEIVERNVMSALGGALGGFGMTTITDFANKTLNKDIIQSTLPEPEIKIEEKEIEPSVVQIKDVETGGIEFKTIKKGELEQFKSAVDGKIAGENIDGKVYHLTAKSPEEMTAVGAKPAGEANIAEIPTPKLSVEPVGGEVTPKVEVKPTETKEDKRFTSRVFERLQEEQPDFLTGDLKVDKIKLTDETKKATDLLVKDKQKAYRIAMGEEQSDNVTSTATNIVMAEKALNEGNNDLYAKLTKARSLAQTRRGQEIVAEKGSVSDNSVSRYVKELISIRLEKVGNMLTDLKRPGMSTKEHANKVIDRKVATLEKKIKNKKLDMKTALKLLDEVTCV